LEVTSGNAREQSIVGAGFSNSPLNVIITDNYDSSIDCSSDTSNAACVAVGSDGVTTYPVASLHNLSLPRGSHYFTLNGMKDKSHNLVENACLLIINVRDVTPATISAQDRELFTNDNCEEADRVSCTSQPFNRLDARDLLTVTDNDMGDFSIQKCVIQDESTCNTIGTDDDLSLIIGEHIFRAVLDDFCVQEEAGGGEVGCTPGADFFKITVTDNTKPLVTCDAEEQLQTFRSDVLFEATMALDVGHATNVQDNNSNADTANPWANMNYNCALTGSTSCLDTCDCSPGGTTDVSYGLYSVEYSANDGNLPFTTLPDGLTDTCTSLIRVRDVTQPVIECPDDVIIYSEIARVDESKEYMTLQPDDLEAPFCRDNRNVETCGRDSESVADGTQLVWGPTQVHYIVSDGTPDEFSCVGSPCSTDTCFSIVTTIDNTNPTLTCTLGGTLSQISSGGEGYHTAYLTDHDASSVTLGIDITANDNRENTDGVPQFSLVGSYTSDSVDVTEANDGGYGSRSDTFTFSPGEHTIKYEVTDQNDNKADCSFVVTVIDAMYPRVKSTGSCPTGIELRNPDPDDATPGELVINKNDLPAYDVSDNYEDNVEESSVLDATYSIGSSGVPVYQGSDVHSFLTGKTTLLVSAHDYNGNSISAWVSGDSETGQISRVGGSYSGDAPASTARLSESGSRQEYCNFDITVHAAYLKLPDTIDAFLNRVFIRVLNAETFSYGAYIEVTTAVPWPHRLNGNFMRVCNEATAQNAACGNANDTNDFVAVAESTPELDTSSSSLTWCAAPADLNLFLPAANCRQRFGTTLAFPDGCAVANQKFHLQFESECSPIGLIETPAGAQIHACSANYANSKRSIIINLTADNYCGRNLADVTIEGTLITLSEALLTTYVASHTYGDDTMPTSTTTWYDGEQVHALMHIQSPNAILNSVTLGQVSRGYYTDENLTTLLSQNDLPTGTTNNPHTLQSTNSDAAQYHVVGANGQDFASFNYEAEVPVQTTLYTKLTATAALTYNLGTQNTNRRLLSRVFRKVLQADNDDSAVEGDRTASTQYLSLNLDLAADPSRIDADGNLGYGLVRIVDVPAGATTASTMATVDTHLERELGAASVDLQFVRNDGPNAMIVAVTHNTSLSAKLQEAVTNENSQLHRNMKAAGGRPAIDPLFFFNGSVPSTSVTMTPGADSDSDSLPAIVGGAVGGGVCCLLILFLLVRRKREAKETKSIEDAMPERVSRASSHASSNRSRRNSVGVAPLDFDGVQIAVGAADTKKSPVTPIAPAAWIDSDSD